MANVTTHKPMQREKPAARERALASHGSFPIFLGRMRDEFDRMAERFFGQWPAPRGDGRRWGVEVEDEDDKVSVRAEAPGFEAGDFDGRLAIRAEKQFQAKGEEGKPRGYSEQSYYESVALPAGVDGEKAEAGYRNGVLTVTLPKTPDGKSRRIPVKGA